jgi:hypothetical protein
MDRERHEVARIILAKGRHFEVIGTKTGLRDNLVCTLVVG